MKFHEFGDRNLPPIILIHGGGSSWWNYLRQARILSEDYRVILPTLNGHGEEYQFLVSLFGKLMFNKFSCKLQLSMMDKIYPKLAYPEEIKAYYLEDLSRTPIKTLVIIYKTYMGRYKLKKTISASKTQVLYIYGEKELNCVKASAKLFQQLHTILYEAKGYNHGYLSAYLPQEWIDLVEPFLKSDPLEI